MDTPQIFGNSKTFAIYCRPCPADYNYDINSKMAICHMIVDNVLVGNPDEECYLPTWIYLMSDMKAFIHSNRNTLFPDIFRGFSDREIFEIINKANQLEEEFNEDFLHLPILDNKHWVNHRFNLDETIDGFDFNYYVRDNEINFS